jgi:uncharacterized phage infection (PIP) family protein YhgE
MSEDLTNKLPKGDDNVASILLNIDSRLQRLEQKVDERLYDARPIWQKVVADIAQLQGGQRELQEGVRELKEDVRELQDGHRELQQGVRQLHEGQQRLEATMASEFCQVNKSILNVFYQIEVLNDTVLNVQVRHRDVDRRVRVLEQGHEKPSNSST